MILLLLANLLQLNTSSAELTYDGISIFPNPVQENLSIKINPVRNAKYFIYSNTGKILESVKINEQGNFNISHLYPDGRTNIQ